MNSPTEQELLDALQEVVNRLWMPKVKITSVEPNTGEVHFTITLPRAVVADNSYWEETQAGGIVIRNQRGEFMTYLQPRKEGGWEFTPRRGERITSNDIHALKECAIADLNLQIPNWRSIAHFPGTEYKHG